MKFVYFIQGAGGGPIKIGESENPRRRLRDLQVSSPVRLELLVAVPSSRRTETLLHGHFADARLHGEWFDEDAPGLAELIEDLINPDLSNPELADIHRRLAALGGVFA